MKCRILLSSLFFIFAIVRPALTQAPAHESTIDGKWEATVTTQGAEQVTKFEFKNGGGEVTGTVTEGKAQPLVINSGRLEGNTLTFGTTQAPRGGGDSIVRIWTGTIIGAGDSIKLICKSVDGGSESRELEAKRVP